MSDTINDDQAQEKMKRIPEWELSNASIVRSFEFDEYPLAIDFVNAVAEIAEEAFHHPDIFISYTKVKLTLTTHDVGGLTESDFEVATRIDSLDY